MQRLSRPFRLTDAMVLIAALAVGFGIVREGASKARRADFTGYILPIEAPEWLVGSPRPGLLPGARYVWVPLGDWSAGDWPTRIMGAWTMLGPCLLTGTLALIGLRLWPPRPAARDLWRQPGWTGCVTSAVLVGATLAPSGVFAVRRGSGLWLLDLFEYAIVFGPIAAGLGVVVVWTAQVLAGRWRPESSWIDRLGRVATVGQIVAGGFLAWYLLGRL